VERSSRTDAFFAEFVTATGSPATRYDLGAFGGPDVATSLAALILAGVKRATAGLARWYGTDEDPMPAPGAVSVLVDADGTPLAILETTHVEVKPLHAVTDDFAWREGEGDRSRDAWLAIHRRFFAAEAAEYGFEFDDDAPVVFESFRVIWPPAVADRVVDPNASVAIRLTRCDTPDAQRLITLLDAELDSRYGEHAEHNELDADTVVFFIADINDEPIGSAAYRPVDDITCELKRMYVHPAARGRRVSALLLETVIDHARAAGFSRMILETGPRQPEAIRRYEARGFTRIPNYPPYVGDPMSWAFGMDL
jgi:uncharacterized protein YhfF/GNAT superfamily N-acetyltransferase